MGNKRVEAKDIVFDGVADVLRVPKTDIRLFGKPESNASRRMGVALAFHADVEAAGMDGEAARGLIADFSCRVPHMKFGDFRNGRTTALGPSTVIGEWLL